MRLQGTAYQGTLEAVFAIPIAIGIGYFLDRWWGSPPTFLLIGAALGFSAFVIRLWRLGRELQQREGAPRDAQEGGDH